MTFNCMWRIGLKILITQVNFRRMMRDNFPGVPIMALTATATPRVSQDVLRQLGMTSSVKWFVQSFNRPNLVYEVRKKQKGLFLGV